MLIHPRPGRTSSNRTTSSPRTTGATRTTGSTSTSRYTDRSPPAKVTEMQRRILSPKAAL
jgi:hypothetical protein